MASTTSRERASVQREGTSRTRVRSEQIVDSIHLWQNGDVADGALIWCRSSLVVPQVGTAANSRCGIACRQRQQHADAFHRAGIDERDELVVEAAHVGMWSRLRQRDGHMNGGNAGAVAHVGGDVFADSDDGIGTPQEFCLLRAGECGIGAEGKRHRGSREKDRRRVRVFERRLQQ